MQPYNRGQHTLPGVSKLNKKFTQITEVALAFDTKIYFTDIVS